MTFIQKELKCCKFSIRLDPITAICTFSTLFSPGLFGAHNTLTYMFKTAENTIKCPNKKKY